VVGFNLFPFEHTFVLNHKKWFPEMVPFRLFWNGQLNGLKVCSKGNKQTPHLTILVTGSIIYLMN
jgi:hypothetical protein